MHSAVSSFVKSELKANKAGQRDTAAEFSTVLPKSGRLTPMFAWEMEPTTARRGHYRRYLTDFGAPLPRTTRWRLQRRNAT